MFSLRYQKKPRKLSKGVSAIAHALVADKWALSKAVVLILIESTFAALLPLGQKMLLDSPSIWTATLATLFSAAQVLCLMVFFDMNDTLVATMERDLNKRVFLHMRFMSKRYLAWIKSEHGQMYSSMMKSLVQNFGSNFLNAAKSVTIVLAQVVGIGIAFGLGSFFWLTLCGLVLMAGLVTFAYRWNKRVSAEKKKLDAQQNNHKEQYASQLDVHQSFATSETKFQLFLKVLTDRVQLFRKNELKRALLIGAPRIVPQLVFMWLIYVIAISENRPPAELAMLSGYVTTSMMVSYSGFQLMLSIADSQGDIRHLNDVLHSSDLENNRPRGDRPQGEFKIDRIETLSLSSDVHVKLPNGDVLFANGLFPHHPHMKELLIRRKECVVCVGAKGSGKSTIANIFGRYSENLSTDRTQWTGVYRINGENVFDTSIESFYYRLFYGPQTSNQVDGIREDEEHKALPGTVRDNIGLFLRHSNSHLSLTPEKKEMWIRRAAAVVKLENKLDQEVSTLSGGEHALCMIGRGVLMMILGVLDVIILDEPFAHLDVSTGKEMSEILSFLAKKYDCALVMINHVDSLNPAEATVYVFGEAGEGIVQWGTVNELRRQSGSHYARILLEKSTVEVDSPDNRWSEICAEHEVSS